MTYCEMGIDFRQYAHVCARGVLKLETKFDRFKGGTPIRVVDL